MKLDRAAGRRACCIEVEVRHTTGAVQNATGGRGWRPPGAHAATGPGAQHASFVIGSNSKCHTQREQDKLLFNNSF